MQKNLTGIGIDAPAESDAPARLGNFARIAVLLAVTFAWVVGAYWQTASEIGAIWWRSDTFAHGLVVIPISAWLIWRKRDQLERCAVRPNLFFVLPMVLSGMAWLVGQISGVAAMSHLALASMLVFALAGVGGREVSRVIAFPLAFLYFGVPVGEFLLPILMQYLADFTVAAVRLTGIPVFQEHLHFVLPNGRWSVIEACSGLRYLIASAMVGTLYAYLNYVSFKRRFLFMLVAIAIPIVANWVRAYITVMIGYHFGSEFVQGFVHIVYGWVFFGIVILLMFAVGARWREEPVADLPSRMPAGPRGQQRWALIVPLALIAVAFPAVERFLDEPDRPYALEIPLPGAASQWQKRTQAAPDDLDYTPTSAGHRAEAYEVYADRSGRTVGLYVAYFAGQRQGREMVMHGNRLDGVEQGGWTRIETDTEELAFGPVVHAGMRGKSDNIVDVWSWYQIDDRIVTDDYLAKAMLLIDRLTGRADASALVTIVVARQGPPEDSRRLAERFMEAHGSELVRLLDDLAERR